MCNDNKIESNLIEMLGSTLARYYSGLPITTVPSCQVFSLQPTTFFDDEAHSFPWCLRHKQLRRLWLELRPDSLLIPPNSNI